MKVRTPKEYSTKAGELADRFSSLAKSALKTGDFKRADVLFSRAGNLHLASANVLEADIKRLNEDREATQDIRRGIAALRGTTLKA